MEKIRLGVVGLGHRGHHMFGMAGKFKCVELTAACDIDPAMWTEKQWYTPDRPMCEAFAGIKFYTDFKTMLDEARLDALLVETGADIHADFCAKALRRNIHVLSDIPNVSSLAEAQMLWEAHLASKAMIMTGANPNEWGFVNALVDLYRKGLLGKPYYLEAEYIHWFEGQTKAFLTDHSPWRKKFAPIQYCTHSLGPLLRIMEEDLRYVSCFATGNHFDEPSEQDNMMAAQFMTESGVVVRLLRNGKCAAKIGHHNYRVFGTEGYFERIDRNGKAVTRFNSNKLYGAKELTELPVDMMPHEYAGNPDAAGHGGADYALLDKFTGALVAGAKTAPISLREGLRMTVPGIYAKKSALQGGVMLEIKYPWDKDFVKNESDHASGGKKSIAARDIEKQPIP